jgi:hypothetical protein
MIDLAAISSALAKAYPPAAADKLFHGFGENFQKTDDGESSHEDHMHDAIADLQARARTLALVAAALDDPSQVHNHALHAVLEPVTRDVRWGLLETCGLMLTAGPFVNRTNLKSALDKLFLGRRVLKIVGSGGALGRSWSRQLITYRTVIQRRAGYCEVDLRKAPEEARSNPSWLAERLRQHLFPQSAPDTFFKGLAENRLIEAFVTGWVPPPTPVIVVIDHLGDDGLGQPVRDFVTAFALAAAGNSLPGLRLVLIDGPPGIDLSEHDMHMVEDIVGSVSAGHFEAFFLEAAKALYPGVPVAELQPIVAAAMEPLAPFVGASGGMSKAVALAVRDSLEAMVMET